MRASLLQYLACPACHGELSLAAQPQATGVNGNLRCVPCRRSYPIVEGVPRFAGEGHVQAQDETVRTRRTYNFTWRRFGRREIERRWEKDSYQYDALIPRGLVSGTGKVGLDAGCGGGADLVRLAAGGAELIGFDLSDGVDVAAELAQGLANVHVVQGDLSSPPFTAGVFDFIYSFGVLHHLSDPQAGFINLAKLLKPGAPLITYLYEDFSDRSRFEQTLLGAVRGVRQVTSRLAPRWLYVLCWLLTPVVWSLCSVPAWVLRRCGASLAERMPFRHTLRWTVIASDLFDRFAPPVEWRVSQQQVLRLYEAAGLEHVEIRRYRGWVSWGFKPVGGSVVDAQQHGSDYEEIARTAC